MLRPENTDIAPVAVVVDDIEQALAAYCRNCRRRADPGYAVTA